MHRNTWFELPFREKASAHFKVYGGRSFIRVYIRVPGWDQQKFYAYWNELYQKHGGNLTLMSKPKPLPMETETILVRTFGTFLRDGSYVDSRFPESITMRIFKYESPKLDFDSSDFRGTELRSFTMKRKRLTEKPASLGLVEDGMNDPSFLGFFKTSPDRKNAYSDALATVRYNCIGCHSELHYGVSTVFSLSRKPPPRNANVNPALQDHLLLKAEREGFFYLQAPAFLDIINNKHIE